jgi:spermidine synthase
MVFTDLFSILIGSQVRQFNIIVSLFTFTLGLGALVFDKVKERFPTRKILITIELSLIFCGLVGPIFLMASIPYQTPASLKVSSYLIATIIGFLSGFELPILFNLYKNSYGKILSFDYVGMIMGTILLPFILIPNLGSLGTVITITSTNLLLLFFYLIEKNIKSIYLLFIAYLCLLYFIYINASNLRDLFSNLYLRGLN